MMLDEENAAADGIEVPSQTPQARTAATLENGFSSSVGINQSGQVEDAPGATARSSNNSSNSGSNGIINTNVMIMTTGNVDTSVEGFAVISASPENNDITFISRSQAIPPPPTQRQFQLRNSCRQFCLVITYPFTVVVSIIGLIVVLIFCVFPTLLFMGVVIGCYYCMNPDPLPLSILLRDLLVTENRNRRDSNPFPNGSGNGIIDPEKAKTDRAMYQTKLIIRRLLEIKTAPFSSPRLSPSASPPSDKRKSKNIGSQCKVVDLRSDKPKLECKSEVGCFGDGVQEIMDKFNLRGHKAPIEVWTDHHILRFSELLEAPTEDSDKRGEKQESKLNTDARSVSGSDVEAIELGSRSQGFFEMEHSSDHLREPSTPTPAFDLQSSEHDATPCNRSVRCGSCDGSTQSLMGTRSSNHEPSDGAIISPGEQQSDMEASTKNCKRNENINVCADSNRHTDYFGIEDDTQDPGTACDICILEFEVGDEIAWSPNLKCSHAFHKDCILDWLIRKPTCPNCRQDYVTVASSETEYS